jgi:hypothetical protein
MPVSTAPASLKLRKTVEISKSDPRKFTEGSLVDGVVEDFPDEVVEPGGSHAADVHAAAS